LYGKIVQLKIGEKPQTTDFKLDKKSNDKLVKKNKKFS